METLEERICKISSLISEFTSTPLYRVEEETFYNNQADFGKTGRFKIVKFQMQELHWDKHCGLTINKNDSSCWNNVGLTPKEAVEKFKKDTIEYIEEDFKKHRAYLESIKHKLDNLVKEYEKND